MSFMQHSREAINRVAQNLNIQAAHVTLRDVFQVGDRFARIVAQASAKATPEQVMKGMRQQFKGVTPVQGSFVSIAANGATNTFTGIIGVVAEKIVLTDDNRGMFKAVAGSMYADGDENLWTLKATESGDIMVKSICDDDAAFMQRLLSLSSVDHNDFETHTPLNKYAEMRATVQGGDLISYVSPLKQGVELGIATASYENVDGTDAFYINVVRRDGGNEDIHRELIVACAEHEIAESEGEEDIAVASGTIDLNSIAAYYSRVFARRPEYYEMFMNRFRSHAFM